MSKFNTAVRVTMLLILSAVSLAFVGSNTNYLNAQTSHTLYLPFITRPNPHLNHENLLSNPSFEGGWYHPGGIPELQIPEDWEFTWQTGPTGFGNDPWDVWVRPEVRVLESLLLPPPEQPLFIWDGNQTLKIFKGWGAISYQLTQNVWLEPGTYAFEMSIFPDLVVGYDDEGNKIWASDPFSGEVKLLAAGSDTGWMLPTFGQKNTFTFVFNITQPQNVQVGTAVRGRYAIRNNGWFTDDWWLWEPPTQAAEGVFIQSGTRPVFADDYAPPAKPFVFPTGPDHE